LNKITQKIKLGATKCYPFLWGLSRSYVRPVIGVAIIHGRTKKEKKKREREREIDRERERERE
jgi:hypothetical protein